MDAFKNFAKGTVSQGYDDVATSIVLVTGQGARFPAAPFNAVWWNSTDYPDPADAFHASKAEIVRVTAKSTDTLTISRGQEGTTAIPHDVEGKTYQLIAGITARTLTTDLLGDPTGATSIEIDHTNAEVRIKAGALISLEVDGGVAKVAPTSDGLIQHVGLLGTDQSASATTPGSVVKKIPLHDNDGILLGYLAVYGSIT